MSGWLRQCLLASRPLPAPSPAVWPAATQRPHHRPTPLPAGAPTAPTSVTVTRGLTSLGGAFTLPADPSYSTLSYRVTAVGASSDSPIMGWKALTPAEIAAGSFTVPDPVGVDGSSEPVPTGLYRIDMRATNTNGYPTPGGEPGWRQGAACVGLCGVVCPPSPSALARLPQAAAAGRLTLVVNARCLPLPAAPSRLHWQERQPGTDACLQGRACARDGGRDCHLGPHLDRDRLHRRG